MILLDRLGSFFDIVFHLASAPASLAILFGSVLLGIIFGAMPGLTSTLGVALLTALTYGMDTDLAMVCLLAIYVGGTYGGSYSSILINIPGTAAAAATALDGYPLACKGEGGRAIGLTTTASAIGTIISMLFVVSISPDHFAFCPAVYLLRVFSAGLLRYSDQRHPDQPGPGDQRLDCRFYRAVSGLRGP